MIQNIGRFDWFKFNGTYSTKFDFAVESMTISVLPERKVQRFSVLGRDGDFTRSNDTYSPYVATIKGLVPFEASFEPINEWLSGKGDLILSYKSGRRFKAEISGEVRPMLLAVCWQLEINLIVQPFEYEADPQPVELTASGALYHPGNRWSLPTITVYGAGMLTIGGQALVIEATAGEDHVVINSDAGKAYYVEENGTLTNRGGKVTGSFPVLYPGEVGVVLGTGITAVEIDGNWRWF